MRSSRFINPDLNNPWTPVIDRAELYGDYVEGIEPSEDLGDIELELRLEDGEGNEIVSDRVSVTVYTVSLITDFNRDRKIDTSDEEILAEGDPFYFWINDDADRNGDVIKSSEDDIPDLPSISSFPNHGDDKVNGMRDLIDFFPVRIMIQPAAVLDSPNTRLRLRTEEGAINIACTSIPDGDHAGDYLTDINTARALQEAVTHSVTDEGYTIDDEEFLERLKTAGQGILIAEGREPMKNQSLILEIEQDMITIVESKLNLSIDSVETMFRYRNLRPSLGASGGGPDRDDVTNFPDDTENKSDVVFIHGYNVTAEDARGWHSEIFKRLFWSGSKARFHGVTWYGDQGLVFKKLRYYADVTNAFNTGEHFADYIDEELKGDVTVMAHSAGNIVVSAAIHDHGASVDRYFMFNAPLSKEVFLGESQEEESQEKNPGLIHAEWRQENNKYNAALYASEWHRLFGDSDSRSKLTWRDRFKNVTEKDVINFYSETDDVLHDYDREGTSSPSIFTALTHPWCAAQLLKGREWNVSMGWGFNDRIYPEGWSYYPVPDSSVSIMYTAREMNDVIAQGTDILKTVPFFSPDGTEDLFKEGEAGSNFAKKNHARIMAYGIPARDYAVGANIVFGSIEKDINMPLRFVQSDLSNGYIWPSNMIELDREGNAFPLWEHSSIRDVAYVYNYTLYDRLSGR